MPGKAEPFPFGKCRICTGKAMGIHYGAATCEGCKAFFKRWLDREKTLTCYVGGNCKITPHTRHCCKGCRLRKCKENGMSIEAIKMGRIPKAEKRNAIKKYQRAKDEETKEISSLTTNEQKNTQSTKKRSIHKLSLKQKRKTLIKVPSSTSRMALNSLSKVLAEDTDDKCVNQYSTDVLLNNSQNVNFLSTVENLEFQSEMLSYALCSTQDLSPDSNKKRNQKLTTSPVLTPSDITGKSLQEMPPNSTHNDQFNLFSPPLSFNNNTPENRYGAANDLYQAEFLESSMANGTGCPDELAQQATNMNRFTDNDPKPHIISPDQRKENAEDYTGKDVNSDDLGKGKIDQLSFTSSECRTEHIDKDLMHCIFSGIVLDSLEAQMSTENVVQSELASSSTEYQDRHENLNSTTTLIGQEPRNKKGQISTKGISSKESEWPMPTLMDVCFDSLETPWYSSTCDVSDSVIESLTINSHTSTASSKNDGTKLTASYGCEQTSNKEIGSQPNEILLDISSNQYSKTISPDSKEMSVTPHIGGYRNQNEKASAGNEDNSDRGMVTESKTENTSTENNMCKTFGALFVQTTPEGNNVTDSHSPGTTSADNCTTPVGKTYKEMKPISLSPNFINQLASAIFQTLNGQIYTMEQNDSHAENHEVSEDQAEKVENDSQKTLSKAIEELVKNTLRRFQRAVDKLYIPIFIKRHILLNLRNEQRCQEIRPKDKEDIIYFLANILKDKQSEIDRITAFASEVPGFTKICTDDKEVLIKRASFEIHVLTMLEFQEHESDYTQESNVMFSKESLSAVVEDRMAEKMYLLQQLLRKFELTHMEIALLCAIQLTSADRVKVKDPRAIEALHSHYLDVFSHVVSTSQRTGKARMVVGIFFNFIPVLREFCRHINKFTESVTMEQNVDQSDTDLQ